MMRKAGLIWLPTVLSLALAIGACSTSEVETDPRRVAAAAEALPGSCAADDCGGQSADGCWCDDACEGYGDCCEDKAAVCDAECPPVLCDIYCPFGHELDDDGCETCVCKPSWYCAGFAPTPCPDDFVCEDIDDDCDPAAGGADCPGVCVPAPAPECPDPDDYCEAVCTGGEIPEIPIGCPVPGCACPEPPPAGCEGACGGQSADGCWCDDECAAYGDCCPDKAATCDGATCADRCGEYEAGAVCQCDDGCETYGDCCDDHGELCTGGCHYAGEDYAVDDTFPATDGCNTCICTVGGHVACTEMGCVACEYEGEQYGEGETFPSADGCNTCTCTTGGKVVCTMIPCYE